MHFGLGLLRLPPTTFWSLTMRELMALGGALRPVDMPDRQALAAMMRRWPDGPPRPSDPDTMETAHGTG